MGAIGYIAKLAGRSIGKTKGTSDYWDVAHTAKHAPEIVHKAAKGVQKAYTVARDHPKPWNVTESAQYRVSKMVADDRVPKLPVKIDTDAAIQSLPKDKGVCADYLQYLVDHVRRKDDIRTIIKYVRSAAAGNLSPDDRASLLIKCLEKLKYIDVIGQFFM